MYLSNPGLSLAVMKSINHDYVVVDLTSNFSLSAGRIHVDVCVPISESILSPHISALDDHNKLSTKDSTVDWKKSGKAAQAKHSIKGSHFTYLLYSFNRPGFK